MPNEKFGLSNVEKGTDAPDKQGVIWIDDTSGDVKLQYNAGGGTPAYKTLGGSGGSGDSITVNTTAVTDADLNDTTPAAAAGGVNVKWQRSGSGPDSVSAYVPGFGAAAIGAVPASGGGTSNYLRADGTWAAPPGTGTNALLDGSKHTDTTAGTVARGDIITGQGASPTWKRLAAGTAGKVLRMGTNEPEWASSLGVTLNGTAPLAYMDGRHLLVASVFGFDNSANRVTSRGFHTPSLSTASAITTDYTDQRVEFTSSTTQALGAYISSALFTARMNLHLISYAKVTDNVDGTSWVGFAPSNFAGAADPPNNSAALRCRNGTDTNWMIVSRDGTTTAVAQDTGVALDTSYHLFEVLTNDAGATWDYYIDGASVGSSTGNLPGTSTAIAAYFIWNANISSTARSCAIKWAILMGGSPDYTSVDAATSIS